jgi:hypothetical protein
MSLREQADRIKPRVKRERNPGFADEENIKPVKRATELRAKYLSPVSRASVCLDCSDPGLCYRFTLGFILSVCFTGSSELLRLNRTHVSYTLPSVKAGSLAAFC